MKYTPLYKRLFALLFFCAALPLSALDYGLAIQQAPEYNNLGAKDFGEWHYTGAYTPWLSTELGLNARFYLSAKLSMEYKDGGLKPENEYFLAELGRVEFAWRPAPTVYLEAGRLQFADPTGFIATGLFDGAQGSVVIGKARLSAGAFYTGLLYKESARILMTTGDAAAYIVPFGYTVKDSYFASRRMLLYAGGEFSDLTPRTSLTVHTLAQFDVNPASITGDELLHTQYLSAKFAVRPLEALTITGTGVLGVAENRSGGQKEGPTAHFAASGGLDWEVPGTLLDLAHGEVRWSSGNAAEAPVRAFAPITALGQGEVFTPKLAGLATLTGKYSARVHRTVSVSGSGTYFFRTDGDTLIGVDYPASDSRMVGGELYGTILWAPASDLMLTLGGGAFLPKTGNVFDDSTPVRWRFATGIVFSF
jgi:hypothetical protein